MGITMLAEWTRNALFLVVLVSAPPILASLVVGLIVSVLQATTQLQDQTLSFVPKALAVMFTLALAGPWMGSQLVNFSRLLFGSIRLLH